MNSFDATKHPHRRYNPLTGEYVLVSPQRTQRPWQGQVDKPRRESIPAYDPDCYLCPGNERAGGRRNPDYESTFVFTNDFQALVPDVPEAPQPAHPLLVSQSTRGTCRVICFTPRHDRALPEMEIEEIRRVVDVWAEQVAELGQTYRWVQVFENRGEMMGASNPHPHGQIWAGDAVPNEVVKEDRQQAAYRREQGSVLLLDYARIEQEQQERVVVANDHWMAVVPYWALWPFETLLMPRLHVLRLCDLGDEERDSLAAILKLLLTAYDNLFEIPFPYSMGWHAAPFDKEDWAHWQLHAHFLPPLLRSATVRKFLVGYEMLAEPQRDLTAEQAAQRLRALPAVHYTLR